MIKPNNYKVASYISYKKLLDAGFVNRSDYYVITQPLYYSDEEKSKPYVLIKLIIDDFDYYKTEHIITSTGDLYVPFHDPVLRHNNKVYEQVVKNYNKFMDGLVKKKILERIDEDGILEEVKTIKIKYHANVEPLASIDQGDLIDLRAAEDVVMKKGEFKLISLGVSMELPKGYKANVYPRSSTYKNFGIILANSVGQIDESYCGDNDVWMFPAIALRDTTIHKNDRIAQFEIVKKQPAIVFETVDYLGNEDRGGIGSTGKK